ncbi:unnamed protein product [Ectocarpus sp. 6 AP-2014]
MDEMWRERFLSGIIEGITLHGRRSCLLDEDWFIGRLRRHNEAQDYNICIEEQEIIWAVIVYYEAFDVADWMEARGYTVEDYNGISCVPYDAAKWDQWLRSCLMLPPSSSLPEKHIENVVGGMVYGGYMKIPLNSGCPTYIWLRDGHTQDDFCDLYSCIEFFGEHFHSGNYTQFWSESEIEECLEYYLDECIRAGTAVYMVRAVSERSPGVAQQYIGKVLAKLLGNMYRRHSARRQLAATKIQCAFRVYRSTKRVNILRSHPDNLFSKFSVLRKRKLEIDDSRFGADTQ